MSRQTTEWLRNNVRVGFTSTRPDGPAWWRGEGYLTDGSHFDGPVPEAEVRRILDVPFVMAQVFAQYTDGDGNRQAVQDKTRQMVISPDDGYVHGVFKMGWQLHGYQEWTADQIAAILDQSRGELQVSSVGLLDHRSVAFIQAKLAGSGLTVGGYGATPYIGAATSVNGSLASTYAVGMEGWVCDNTMYAGLQTALAKKKVKHSRNSIGRLGEVRDYLGLAYEAGETFEQIATQLQDTPVSDKQFGAWLDLTAPAQPADPKSSTGGAKYTNAEKVRSTLTDMWAHDPKVKPWAGTAFGVVQLSNTYRTWERPVKGADGGRFERVMLNMVDGTTAKEDDAAMAALAKVLGKTELFTLA